MKTNIIISESENNTEHFKRKETDRTLTPKYQSLRVYHPLPEQKTSK